MDPSERLTQPSPVSSSLAPPSKCSSVVSSVFSPPLSAYGRSQAFGLYTSSLESSTFGGLKSLDLSAVFAAHSQYGKISALNGTVNSSHPLDGKGLVKPDFQRFTTKQSHVKDLKEPEKADSMSSQSGSVSGSSDDTDGSSDPEHLEEEGEEEEEDPSDGSDATDSEKDYEVIRKLPSMTHTTSDTPKKSPGSTAGDTDTTRDQRNQHSVPIMSTHPPSPLLSKPSEEQHLRKALINPDMKEQDWWSFLKSKTSHSPNSLFLSSPKSPSLSDLPKLPVQKLSHGRLLMSSSIDNVRSMTSRGLHVNSGALKRLPSISNPSTQDQDVRVKNSTSQSSSLSSLSRHFLSSPTKNKTAPLLNFHTNGLTQDAPLALVTSPRNPTNKPLAPCSQFTMPINYLSSKPSISPYKGGNGLICQTLSSCNLNGQNKTGKVQTEDSEDSLIDGNDTEDTSSNTSDSGSSVGVNSESSDDVKCNNSETNSNGYRAPQKLDKLLTKSSPGPSANFSVLKTSCSALGSFSNAAPMTHNSSVSSTTVPLPVQRKRVTDEKALRVPLDFGWQRVTRVWSVAGRLQGEVCYLAPCGKKLRLYPDVLKYLLRNGITEISRENFSFSTKIHLGEFYKARDGPEGVQWMPLSKEEITPCIIAMDGRRQRKVQGQRTFSGVKPLVHSQDGADAKLLRKLEAQEIARQAAHMKIMKKLEKQARAQAAKEAKKQRAILVAEEKRKKKEQLKILKQEERIRRIQQIRLEKEVRAQQILEAKRKKKEEAANAKILKAEKRSQERAMRRQHAILQKHQVMELHRLDIVWEKERRRQHLILLKEAEARKKAEEKERLKKERNDEKLLNKERKLELRRLELQELKKPREDLCLMDHKPLPDLSRVPGLVLSGGAFSDCLMVLQFVHRFGKVLSLNPLSLSDLQGGLLNLTDCVDKVQELVVHMVSAAVRDPSLSHTHKMKTALGELLSNMKLDSDNVSEALRIYMENHCDPDSYMSSLALSLKTKDFRALQPSQKASILAFLVNRLCCCKAVVSEIDKTIDHMANLRKEKWIVEGALRKLRRIHAKKTGTKAAEGTQNCDNLAATNKRKRKEGESEEDEDEEEESDDEEDEEAEEEEGKKAKRTEEEQDDSVHSGSVEELEKDIARVAKQQTEVRQKLLESSYSLRSMMLGQDRYKRSYWLLPECGGVFVEGMETEQDHEDVLNEKRYGPRIETLLKDEEVNRETTAATDPHISIHTNRREPMNTTPDKSPLDSTHCSSLKYKNNSWTRASVPPHHDSSVFVNQWIRHLPPPCEKPSVHTSSVSSSSPSQMFSARSSTLCGPTEDGNMQQHAQSGTHHGGEILCDVSSELTSSVLPFAGSSGPPARDPTSQHAPGHVNTAPLQTSHRSVSDTQPHAPSSSPPAVEMAPHQDHSNPTPVPKEMLSGWWWMSNVEELNHLCKALHCRGVRERALAKQTEKHMEYLTQIYSHKDDAVIDVTRLQKQGCCKEMVERWCVQQQAMKWDISALKQVQALESRVISACLQVKDWTPPKPQSQWEDQVHHEHKSSSSPAQHPKSPLDTAVSRLEELERNIERRKEEEDAPWRRQWYKALAEVHSSAQLVLCIQQLQNNISWDRSITKVECQICHSGDDEESLLLCDGCDKGCHVYCHKPKITSIPEGDWFCRVCSNKTTSGFVIPSVQSLRTQTHPSPTSGGGKRASEGKPNGKPSVSGELIKEETASRSSTAPRKSIKEGKKRKADSAAPVSETKRDPPVSKKPKTRDRGTDELEVCQQLLCELEAHQDAWPFLKPVNLKSVPGYKKVVKRPMDLSTIREKIANQQYSSLESFTDDVNLVFDNCERFNEDDSEIGKAGHIMRRFFTKRKAELLKS
ncbi:bromodomain adjacent to zinc finger domain protein 2B [Boleophthalmus pectinirostris]|uniref:bromodomain adjacent to zinc finger domain protein 2B n=1 Tax=Boleophthalmus pectinirostris TaxID=150288 RepID=UPI00242FD3AB|nr:bromodomain adjacent to zinc finger domain protein 2B [Boleophthalmus pectinirostris]